MDEMIVQILSVLTAHIGVVLHRVLVDLATETCLRDDHEMERFTEHEFRYGQGGEGTIEWIVSRLENLDREQSFDC